ncbi:MAG: DUF1360 domain-containing protein [bacterium]
MAEAALLSLATAWLAFTVAETALFAPLRQGAGKLSAGLGKLVSCSHCLGFWFALGLVFLYRPRLFAAWPLLDYLLTALAIAWVSSFQAVALSWLMERTGK